MSTPPKNNGPRTHAPENGRDNAKAAILLYDWIEGEKGAFDKISEARSELFLSNASTMRPMMFQPAPPPIFCATLGKMKVPMLVTRGERDNSFYVLKTDTFASCLPPGNRAAIIPINPKRGLPFDDSKISSRSLSVARTRST